MTPTTKLLWTAFVVAGLFVVGAGSAQADTITFDSLEVSGAGFTLFDGTYTEAGFDLDTNATDSYEWDSWQQSGSGYSGSAALGASYLSATITLTDSGSGAFSIQSIDLDGLFAGDTGSITFTGTYADTTTIDTTFSFDNTLGMQTFHFGAGWAGLTMVDWDQGVALGGGKYSTHQFDNIVLNTQPVPEPGTWTLMGLGMVGLAYQRRRKMKARYRTRPE